MLGIENSCFMLIDVQGKLAQLMHDRDALFDSLARLVQGIRALQVPIVWTEQNAEKMGPTIDLLRDELADLEPLNKMSFSCWGDPSIRARLESLNRDQVILAGIETHVCVFQTTADLVETGYEVHVVTDAVSSRTAANREVGLERIRTCGARLTSVESVLFELMRTSEHPAFRDVLKIVK